MLDELEEDPTPRQPPKLSYLEATVVQVIAVVVIVVHYLFPERGSSASATSSSN
jgi:hypothetical protein